MTEVKPTFATGSICVANDVDRAAIGQQVIPLWSIGELVDPRQVNQQQSARVVGRGVQAIEIYSLMAMVGSDADKVALLTHSSNCLKSEAIGLKPSPTSGRVSMEIQRGGALSKMKLTNVWATGPSLQ